MIFRQVIPNSKINEGNENYEHYLIWLSPKTGVRNWFFSHTEGEEETSYKGIEIESLTNIRSIPTEERDGIKVITEGLSSEEYEYVKSILSSNRIYKVTKSMEKIPVSISYKTIKKNNRNKNFSLSFSLSFKESESLDV